MAHVPWFHPRWARLLPLAFLVLLLPVRLGDLLHALQSTNQLSAVPITIGGGAVLAIFGLTALVIVRRGHRRPIIATLVVLTFGPGLALGSGWVELAGLLCGVVLITVAPLWSWVLYLAVAVADATVHGILRDSISTAFADLSTNGNLGIALFAVTRLAWLVEETDLNRAELAAARAHEELTSARADVRAKVGARLSAIIVRTDTIVSSGRWDDLMSIAESAREAVRKTNAATATPKPTTDRLVAEASRIGVSFEFARAMVLGMLACYVVNAFSDVGQIGVGLSTKVLIVHFATTFIACALQLYHGVARADGREPRWWPWTFAFQWILAAPVTVLFTPLIGMSIAIPLVLSTTLIRLRSPWSFIVVGVATTVAIPLTTRLVLGPEPTLAAAIALYVFMVFGMVLASLTMYAVYRLPIVTQALYETSDELAHVVATTQRLRFARDVHDRLGVHLSAITLTSELAARAASYDPDRARELVAGIRGHAEAALVQIRAIESGARVSLADEIVAARSLLEAADMRVVTDGAAAGSAAPQEDHVLGVIMREAVTNIVRHSAARLCTITLHHTRSHVRLRITNDGAARASAADGAGGNGLRNLRDRAREAGGVLTAGLDGEMFTVAVDVPISNPHHG